MNDKKKTSQDILAWTIRLFLYLMLIILPFVPHLLDISGEGEKAMGLSLLIFLSPLAILTAILFFSRFNCIHITKLDICVFLLTCYILLQSLFLHHRGIEDVNSIYCSHDDLVGGWQMINITRSVIPDMIAEEYCFASVHVN